MSDLITALRFVTVDIVLLGLITLALCDFILALWRASPGDAPRAFRRSWWRFSRRFIAKGASLKLAGYVLIGAVLGMLINVVADEALDNEGLIQLIPRTPMPWGAGKWGWLGLGKQWEEEDRIKYDQLANLGKRTDEGEYPTPVGTLERHAPEIKAVLKDKCRNRYKECEWLAKVLFQAAEAATKQRGSEPLQRSLQYELCVIKVLRVLFLDAVIVFAVFVLKLIWTAAAACWKGWKALQERVPLASVRNGVLLVLALVLSQSFLLYLWTEQSKRYCKKLIYGYVAVLEHKAEPKK